MTHVLCQYDIPESLKIKNPSAVFHRYGARMNLSSWAFPEGSVPTEEIDRLREAGADVHLVRFHPEDQGIILDLIRKEMRKHLKKIVEGVEDRCQQARTHLEYAEDARKHGSPDFPQEDDVRHYRKWRSVLAKARRELIAAGSCAFGFQITGDVQDALDSLRDLLAAELGLALAWKDRHEAQAPEATVADSLTYPLVMVPAV